MTALRQAAETGTDRDIKQARALFFKAQAGRPQTALAAFSE